MRYHMAPLHIDTDFDIRFETYKYGNIPIDSVECVHCGFRALEYIGDEERWPIGYQQFAEHHEANADYLRREGFTNAEPHLRLRGEMSARTSALHICPMCGWWVAIDKAILLAAGSQAWLLYLVCASILMELDTSDIDQPLTEVRKFLRRRYESRYLLNPRVYEETVASVFRDIGFRSEVTAYTNDGGIDVVLYGCDDRKIGVQVKRQRRSIEVEQVRAFLGALTLGGFAHGLFVSTSPFQRGAVHASEQSTRGHIPIELVDPIRFFDMLGIAQLCGEPDPDACGFYQAANHRFVQHGCLHLNSL